MLVSYTCLCYLACKVSTYFSVVVLRWHTCHFEVLLLSGFVSRFFTTIDDLSNLAWRLPRLIWHESIGQMKWKITLSTCHPIVAVWSLVSVVITHVSSQFTGLPNELTQSLQLVLFDVFWNVTERRSHVLWRYCSFYQAFNSICVLCTHVNVYTGLKWPQTNIHVYYCLPPHTGIGLFLCNKCGILLCTHIFPCRACLYCSDIAMFGISSTTRLATGCVNSLTGLMLTENVLR